MTAQKTDSLASRLSKLDSCSVSDALDKLGIGGAVIGLPPLTVQQKIAGRVMTVKLGAPLADAPKRHLCVGAIMAADPGDVIVIEHRNRLDVAGWGGLLSRAACRKGIAGVIIDGACRDVDESRMLGLPVFGRAAVPVTARGRIAEHDFGQPITIAGLCVNPGDYVLADGSGVVFVDGARAETVIAAAESIFAKETLMAEAVDRGEPLDQVMGANYEDMLKKGGESR